MFFYLYAQEHGLREAAYRWWRTFKENSAFRRTLCLAFFTTMILFQTLLNRNMWENPLSDIMGGWSLYNSEGKLTTESIENLMLFIPFSILLLWAFNEKLLGKHHSLKYLLWQSTKIVFLFSLSIEFLQLFLRLGTFQLSDLFYNTLGGFLGGLIYWCGCRIKKKEDRSCDESEDQ